MRLPEYIKYFSELSRITDFEFMNPPFPDKNEILKYKSRMNELYNLRNERRENFKIASKYFMARFIEKFYLYDIPLNINLPNIVLDWNLIDVIRKDIPSMEAQSALESLTSGLFKSLSQLYTQGKFGGR